MSHINDSIAEAETIKKTKSPSAPKYTAEIQAMMYTCGDVRTVQTDTAILMETLVHAHLAEIIIKAASVAGRRSSRSLTTEDIMFTIRRDLAKVQRLKDFLGWKDLRKNAKPVDETTASAVAMVPPVVGIEDSDGLTVEDRKVNNQLQLPASSTTHKKRPPAARIPWDYLSNLVADLTDGGLVDFDPDDGLDGEYWQAQLRERLQTADRVTRGMSRSEYLEYTECRQASFTYKKSKKFREWINPATFSVDYRLGDDVIEVLGFLAGEAVRRITEVALQVKARLEERTTNNKPPKEDESGLETDDHHSSPDSRFSPESSLEAVRKFSPFNGPRELTAIQPAHLHLAMQQIRDNNIFLLQAS